MFERVFSLSPSLLLCVFFLAWRIVLFVGCRLVLFGLVWFLFLYVGVLFDFVGLCFSVDEKWQTQNICGWHDYLPIGHFKCSVNTVHSSCFLYLFIWQKLAFVFLSGVKQRTAMNNTRTENSQISKPQTTIRYNHENICLYVFFFGRSLVDFFTFYVRGVFFSGFERVPSPWRIYLTTDYRHSEPNNFYVTFAERKNSFWISSYPKRVE